MTDITVEARQLIDAGGWLEMEDHDEMFLLRRFSDQEQAVKDTGNPAVPFRLSQIHLRVSRPEHEGFATLEAALTEADVWRREKKVEPDEETQKEFTAARRRLRT